MKNDDTNFDYNKVFNTIKTGSPIHAINLDINNPNAIVGMYLIASKNPKEIIGEYIKKPTGDDYTILVFESRHIAECIQILYGVFSLLISMDIYEEIIIKMKLIEVMKYLLQYPHTYKEFKKYIESFSKEMDKSISDGDSNYNEVMNNLIYIINNIWYLTYYDIDQILEKATKEFKDSNEGNIEK